LSYQKNEAMSRWCELSGGDAAETVNSLYILITIIR